MYIYLLFNLNLIHTILFTIRTHKQYFSLKEVGLLLIGIGTYFVQENKH